MSNRYDSETTFVPARRDAGQDTQIVEVEPAQLPALPDPAPHSTHVDRAKGFSIATTPLAASVGAVAALVGIVGAGVPLMSLAALLLALGGFCAVWLAAYVTHVLVSSDGVHFLHAVMMWRHLQREQRERHRRWELLRDRNERGR